MNPTQTNSLLYDIRWIEGNPEARRPLNLEDPVIEKQTEGHGKS
jgi:hypothetical protein